MQLLFPPVAATAAPKSKRGRPATGKADVRQPMRAFAILEGYEIARAAGMTHRDSINASRRDCSESEVRAVLSKLHAGGALSVFTCRPCKPAITAAQMGFPGDDPRDPVGCWSQPSTGRWHAVAVNARPDYPKKKTLTQAFSRSYQKV